MTEQLGFTNTVTLGALVGVVVAVGVLGTVRVVTRRRIGLLEVLEAVLAAGALAAVQVLLVSDGFGKLHVAYLYLFLTLPILGAVVLAAGLVPSVRPQRWALVGAAGLLLLGAVGFYGTHIEPTRLRTERVSLDVASVDGGGELRIGVLADLQTEDIRDHERRAVDRLLAEDPDLILMPGDYFQSDGPSFDEGLADLRELLARIDAPAGVFMTEGDVDSPERIAFMTEGLDNLRWLDEEVVTIEVRGHTVHLGGISVRYEDEPAQAVIDELATIGGPDDLRILVSHRPDAVYEVPAGGVDLVVSGHTHGGQVQLPWIGPPITMSNVPRDVAAGGLHELEGTPIYVSNGVGMERATAPQVRLGTPPSVGLVTLR